MLRAATRRWSVLLALFVLAACTPPPQRTVDALQRSAGTASIALLPLDVELFELSAAGVPEPRADWTEMAHRNLDVAFQAEQAQRGLTFTVFDANGLADAERARLAQVQRLNAAVGAAIAMHHGTPFALPSKGGRLEWSIGSAAAELRQRTGADYALLVHVRDSYSSAGRVALMVVGAVLGVGIPGGQQVGHATLVDLRSGEVVWFNRLLRATGDLRTTEAAGETARSLLAGLPQ